jgi:hypothetical protein
VLGPDGTPVPGAEILVGDEQTHSMTADDAEVLTSAPPRSTWTDDRGEFALDAIATGKVPVMARAKGFTTWKGSAEIASHRTTHIVVDLAAGSVVRGVVRDGEGHPVSSASVASGSYGDFASLYTKTRADGSFALERVAAGRVDVRVDAEALGDARTQLEVPPGAVVEWNPVLDRAPGVAGIVLDAEGRALANWMVGAVDPQFLGVYHRLARSDAQGAFELENWPDGASCIEVREPDQWTGPPVAVVREFTMGARDLVIRIASESRATAFVEGTLLSSEGLPLARGRVHVWPLPVSIGNTHDADSASGRFRIGPLRPGPYRLEFEGRGAGRTSLDLEVEPNRTLDLGQIRLEPAGWVRVRLKFAEGQEIPGGVSCGLIDPRGNWAAGVEFDGAEGRSDGVAPGEYIVRVSAAEVHAEDAPVHVVAREETLVEVATEPATWRQLELRLPADVGELAEVHVVVRDATGRVASDFKQPRTPVRSKTASSFVSGLLVGTYDVEVSASELSGRATIVIADLARPTNPIPIELR